MPVLPLARLALHLAVGLCKAALLFPLLDASGRERRIQRWSHQLVRICGISLQIDESLQQQPASPALIICNHISWLDIFVINTIHPCRFVAKSDIRDWPLIGWLCDKSGTIFIARGRQRDVRRIYAGLVQSIHAGERVSFFPEGTTASQGTVLPFHANLFEAAIEAGTCTTLCDTLCRCPGRVAHRCRLCRRDEFSGQRDHHHAKPWHARRTDSFARDRDAGSASARPCEGRS